MRPAAPRVTEVLTMLPWPEPDCHLPAEELVGGAGRPLVNAWAQNKRRKGVQKNRNGFMHMHATEVWRQLQRFSFVLSRH